MSSYERLESYESTDVSLIEQVKKMLNLFTPQELIDRGCVAFLERIDHKTKKPYRHAMITLVSSK